MQRAEPQQVLKVGPGTALAAHSSVGLVQGRASLFAAKTLQKVGGEESASLYPPERDLLPAGISLAGEWRDV